MFTGQTMEFQVKESSCSIITSKLLDTIFKDICSAFYTCSLVLSFPFIYQKSNNLIELKRYYFGQGQALSIFISTVLVYETYISFLLVLALLYLNFLLIFTKLKNAI